MRTTRVSRLAALLLLVLVAASGCTSDGEPDPQPPPSDVSPSLVPVVGGYVYRGPGVEATVDLETGSLEVYNTTGRTLPAPGLYLLDARDGSVIEVVVRAASPVADGRTAGFDVRPTVTIEPRHVGLVVLRFGQDDYGAFVPAAGDAS